MNHDPRFPTPDEQEWSAQERALAEERAGLPPTAGDARLRSYRLMAHVLAQPLEAQLPADFSRQVARRVQQATAPADARLERSLLTSLLAALVLAGLIMVFVYGPAWLPSLDLGGVGALLAKPWIWVMAACLGFTRLSRHWWLHHGHPA